MSRRTTVERRQRTPSYSQDPVQVRFLRLPFSRSTLRRRSWGWDWGPVLMTVGPWKPIYLHTYTHRITDLRITSNVDKNLSVTGQVTFTLSEPAKEGFKVTASIKSASGAQLVAQELSADAGKLEFSLKPEEVELWFPIGYGKQALHTFTVALKDTVRVCTVPVHILSTILLYI